MLDILDRMPAYSCLVDAANGVREAGGRDRRSSRLGD